MRSLCNKEVAPCLLISGGHGHATKHLIANIERTKALPRDEYDAQESEASLLSKIVRKNQGKDKGEIFQEATSTNTGENAKNSLDAVLRQGIRHKKVLLLEDPLLMRRAKLTFEKNWKEEDSTFVCFSPYLPVIRDFSDEFKFVDDSLYGLWEKNYFLSLIQGEMRRLTDNENGYGPMGAGFIDHVCIPEKIVQAYLELKKSLPGFEGER